MLDRSTVRGGHVHTNRILLQVLLTSLDVLSQCHLLLLWNSSDEQKVKQWERNEAKQQNESLAEVLALPNKKLDRSHAMTDRATHADCRFYANWQSLTD